MLKKSTLLFVSILFLLFIGLSDYGYGCHRNNLTHGKNPKECDPEPPEPPPDDEGTTGTPVIVTFDDWANDSIKSDDPVLHRYVHEGTKTGVTAILDGSFVMILRAGGVRKLFINFGDIVLCSDNSLDCVLDDSVPRALVECPFPLSIRTTQNGDPTNNFCSALVQAALEEHDVFDPSGPIPDPDVIDVHVQDMLPTGLENRKVRPFQEYDIAFALPRSAKGNKTDLWLIAFSAKQENCLSGAPAGFPEFLNIIAVDTTTDGIENVDTWHIGTFDNGAVVVDDPRIACLLTAEGGAGQADDVVGFFEMSFKYKIEIIQPEP